MTLQKSQLLPLSLCDIAAQALCGQGQYGAVTRIAETYDVTRQTVYRIRDEGHQALVSTFSLQEPVRWNADVPDTIVDRGIVSLYVLAHNSIDNIVDLLPILYGGLTRSHGYVWKVIHTAEQNALQFLEGIDLSDIRSVAIDEMFRHNTPVLTGIDLDSGLWFSAEKVRRRDGPEWVSRLEALKQQGLNPLHILKDAGTAMAEACRVVFPNAELRDDLFHSLALLTDLAKHFDQIAYRAIHRFDKAQAKCKRAKTASRRQALEQEQKKLEIEMEAAIKRADTFEKVRREVEGVLSLCSPGQRQLRRAEEVRAQLPVLATQICEFGGDRAKEVCTYLMNRVDGLSFYLEELNAGLASCAQMVGDPELVGSVVRAYQAGLRAGRGQTWQREAGQVELNAAVLGLVDLSGTPERLVRVLEGVLPLLERRHRASSAIECVHSVIRPYIAVHKRLTQGFLDLLRFYWNTRIRRWGRHKGTSALEVLSGQKHADWLTLLGFPLPDES